MTGLSTTPQALTSRPGGGRAKFLVGGLIVVGAIVYLIVTSLQSTAQYFYTVEEVQAKGGSLVGKNLRVSGAVLGDTIQVSNDPMVITFTMAQVSNDSDDIAAAGGLAAALHQAVSDPDAARITVVYRDQPKPDLLKDEAQAIVTGTLGDDGVFYADELLLKCPTRYEESVPGQAEAGG